MVATTRYVPFSKTVAGANATVNLYSLLQTRKVNGIDSYRYLNALLVALQIAQTADDCEALVSENIVLLRDNGRAAGIDDHLTNAAHTDSEFSRSPLRRLVRCQ